MSTRAPLVRCLALAAILLTVRFAFAAAPTTARSDLADLREREREVRRRLRDVEQQLLRLSGQATVPTTAPAAEARQRRLVALNQLRTKYQFRLDELARELREVGARLSIDGVSGNSGRIATKEMELGQLLKTQFEVSRNAAEAKAAHQAAMAQVNNGEDLPTVKTEIERDVNVQTLRKQLTEVPATPPQPNAERGHKEMIGDLQRRLDDAVAEVRARVTATVLEGLRQQKDATEAQATSLAEKVDAAKADLSDLSKAMQKYLTVRDDEKTVRELQRNVEAQLEVLDLAARTADETDQTRQRAQDQMLARATQLNNFKTRYQFELDEVRKRIAQAEAEQAAGMFAGTVDVYMSQEDVHNKTPSIAGATYAGTGELGGRSFVKLTNAAGTWSVDPGKIVAVRASGASK